MTTCLGTPFTGVSLAGEVGGLTLGRYEDVVQKTNSEITNGTRLFGLTGAFLAEDCRNNCLVPALC